LIFYDPARAPKSDPDGATKKSSPYGTFKISRPTRKSALEITARITLGYANDSMERKNEFLGARPRAPPYQCGFVKLQNRHDFHLPPQHHMSSDMFRHRRRKLWDFAVQPDRSWSQPDRSWSPKSVYPLPPTLPSMSSTQKTH